MCLHICFGQADIGSGAMDRRAQEQAVPSSGRDAASVASEPDPSVDEHSGEGESPVWPTPRYDCRNAARHGREVHWWRF